jgi:hypothetical protein
LANAHLSNAQPAAQHADTLRCANRYFEKRRNKLERLSYIAMQRERMRFYFYFETNERKTMHKWLVAALVALSVDNAIAQSSADLVRLTAKDVPIENGKQLNMTFEEIRRAPDASLVEVSGLSAPSSMFILKGMCSIAESRGKQYFRVVQLSKKPLRYGVTFPEDAGPSDPRPARVTDKVFSLAECSLLNF